MDGGEAMLMHHPGGEAGVRAPRRDRTGSDGRARAPESVPVPPPATPGEPHPVREAQDVFFEVLGPVAVVRGTQRVHVASRRQRVVLAALLLSAGRVVSLETLIEAIWSERPPDTARNQVHTCVSALRRLLARMGAQTPIETLPGGYLLRVPFDQVDLQLFRTSSAKAAERARQGRYEEAIALMRQALAHWKGPGCADVDSEVIQSRVVHLDEEFQRAMDHCVEWNLALGRHSEVIGELIERVARHPLRELPRLQLVQALHRSGRTAEALDVCRHGRREFVEQLGLEPSEEMARLEARILARDPALDWPGTAVVTETVTRTAVPRQLLPGIGDFVGRRTTLALVTEACVTGRGGGRHLPVVCLAGASGTGKTVTALRVAHELSHSHFPDGQLFADLGGSAYAAPPDRILRRFLLALGVPAADVPAGTEERAALYRSLLADRRVLVFLDHIATQAQIRPLLPGGSSCGVLLTSRRRAAVPPGAVLVQLGALDEAESLELLGATAGWERVRAEPTAAHRITELTGGLPMALRIVGARMAGRPYWSLETMAARLADPRRRLDELVHGELSVRAGIEAALCQLSTEHRTLLLALARSVAGPFHARFASRVLGVDRGTAGKLLEDLADVYLIEHLGGAADADDWYRIPTLTAIHVQEAAERAEPGRSTAAEIGR
ncbi:BTAD domain-containing putative transcriptional regulator [Streptomyces sp. NPDC052721]|uniref:AfsR/SARP family transcriptional regulator n=1 Tax=Streptomyces sp. NPDC052721 TaxID=3154955 RepID=UPI0034493658